MKPAGLKSILASPELRAAARRVGVQLKRIAAWLSQGVNCILLGGHHDQTVSARAYVEYRLRGNRRWKHAYHGLNWLFRVVFGQDDHCLDSFLEDEHFAREIHPCPSSSA